MRHMKYRVTISIDAQILAACQHAASLENRSLSNWVETILIATLADANPEDTASLEDQP